MSWGISTCLGCILCQERLRLSSKVDECKPLGGGGAQQREEQEPQQQSQPSPFLGRDGGAGSSDGLRRRAWLAGAYTRPLLSSK